MRPRHSTALLIGLCAASAITPACSFFERRPEIAETRTFRGPAMTLDSAGRVHVVTMRAPNPGWNVELDRDEETAGPTRLLLTVRRPDPAFLYTQQVVEKSIASRVRTGQPVEVFARVLDHNDKGKGAAYERVLLGTGPE